MLLRNCCINWWGESGLTVFCLEHAALFYNYITRAAIIWIFKIIFQCCHLKAPALADCWSNLLVQFCVTSKTHCFKKSLSVPGGKSATVFPVNCICAECFTRIATGWGLARSQTTRSSHPFMHHVFLSLSVSSPRALPSVLFPISLSLPLCLSHFAFRQPGCWQ